MSRPVRRVALFGYLGSGNIGNDATFETVLGWLRSTQPDVEVRCITIAPEEITARYGVPSVPLAWRSSASGGNRITKIVRKLFGRLLDVPRSYTLAGSADAIIVPGMGVLEATLGVHPWGMPLWLFLTAAACRLRGRRFVLLDVGAEYAANPVTRWLNVATVGLATHVSYRDQASAAAMARAGAREPEAIAPDLVFAHPAPTRAKPERGRFVVGVMAFYGEGDDPVRGAEVRRRYVATMANALAQVVDPGDHVVFVSGDRVDVDVAHDLRAAVLNVRPDLPGDAVLVREFTTFTELTEEMMHAEIVIPSRFHNLICALRLARPTVSAGYAKKNHQLMEALGLEAYSQDMEHLDETWLVAKVRAAREEADALSTQIRRGTSEYADEVDSLLQRVADEALDLTPQPWRRVDTHDEIDAWYGG
ncbi:MAG: polysaccharide pyruvyl transferase family protein [Vicinamibacterales bacterium]